METEMKVHVIRRRDSGTRHRGGARLVGAVAEQDNRRLMRRQTTASASPAAAAAARSARPARGGSPRREAPGRGSDVLARGRGALRGQLRSERANLARRRAAPERSRLRLRPVDVDAGVAAAARRPAERRGNGARLAAVRRRQLKTRPDAGTLEAIRTPPPPCAGFPPVREDGRRTGRAEPRSRPPGPASGAGRRGATSDRPPARPTLVGVASPPIGHLSCSDLVGEGPRARARGRARTGGAFRRGSARSTAAPGPARSRAAVLRTTPRAV